MKKILTLILLLASFQALPSHRHFEYYSHEFLDLSYCSNYTSNYEAKQYLYYKGLSIHLNLYIKQQVEANLLPAKKFQVQLGCKDFGGHPAIDISQSSTENYIAIHGDANLSYLIRIVDYFASEHWKSFTYDMDKVDSNVAKKTFNLLLEKYTSEKKTSSFEPVKVWRKEGFWIEFVNDQLILKSADGISFDNFQAPWLVTFKNGFAICQNNQIKFFSNGKLVETIPFKDEGVGVFEMRAFNKWVNVYSGNKAIISYSIEKQQAFDLRAHN